MSYFSGVTFAEQKVTPADDAAVRDAVFGDSLLKGCAFSYSGYTLTMAIGQLIVCGRQIRHTSAENWAVVDATSGYARLVLTIDLTRSSSKELFDQILTEVQYAASLNGFPALTQEDINTAGTVYQVVLCVVSLGTGGITGIVSCLPDASAASLSKLGGVTMALKTVTLPVAAWVGTSQTVSVSGVPEDDDSSAVIPSPASASHTAYYDSGTRLSAQAKDTLTFTCDNIPGRDLTVQVLILVKEELA